ncbi:hypothetical protein L1049_000089 [Liquidambar formosana]|uniref:AT hook motif-containing protein n=1 Tax=Liquidambar formosana TaxID=63359 RepID=A0AAP0NAU9_LIQFO
MNQPDQGNDSVATANVPVKRKRGRPRKDKSLNRGENAPAPPGFGGVNGNQPRQVEPVEDANDVMVGQAVSGVVEAAFDAGYLLSVRVGNSDTTLRGVVFKAGRYVPVSAENDVAPNVQMIRRNEIHFPMQNQIQVHGNNPRSRERNEHHRHRNKTSLPFNESQPANQVPRVGPRAANLIASKGKQVPAVASQAALSVASRGNVVPVVLQPVNLSNGLPPATQAPHLVSSKGKQVLPLALQAAHISNGSAPANQVPNVANQVLTSQSQTSQQVASTGVQNEGDPLCRPMPQVLEGGESKSMNLHGGPFETLLGEVEKRIQVPSQSAETEIDNSESSGKLSNKDSGFTLGAEVPHMNEPLLIKPLQAVQPNLHNQSVSVPKPLENDRTGRMTELLQVVHENMMENQASQVQHPDAGSTLQSHEMRSPKAELAEEETVNSKPRSRASSV